MVPEQTKPAVVGKPVPAVVLLIGAHPIVYSTIAILAIGAIMFFLLIVPPVRAMQAGGPSSVSSARDQYEIVAKRLDAEKKIINSAAGLSVQARKLLTYALPDVADAPGLSVQMHAIGLASGVRVTGVDISKPTGEAATANVPAGIESVDVAISVDNTSYTQVKLLLRAIDSSLRLMDMRNMNYSPGSHSASLDIRTYYLKGN